MGRSLIKYIILLSIILLGSYYIYIINDTREIMSEFRKVINDEDGLCNVNNDKLLVFRQREDSKVVSIFRYFTWCYKDKGKIWLYRKEEHIVDGKIYKVPDYFSVSIVKKDGEWLITSINIVP